MGPGTIASPCRQDPIVSMSGDGGLSMLMGELLTVREHRLPIKIVACGLRALKVDKPTDVHPAFVEALRAPGPVLVDVVTDPDALSIPPHITPAQVKGFALAATRTVLDGGVGKMIDLARSNLRNIPRP
jgi:pyruvate dehydrogenase (quinone)